MGRPEGIDHGVSCVGGPVSIERSVSTNDVETNG